MKCQVCNKNGETRLGVCFDCAEAESIIADGSDMHDNKIKDGHISSMDKLKWLVANGWQKSEKTDIKPQNTAL